jgi:Reverse transcriptase (RNA-dependent DNA polymerase)
LLSCGFIISKTDNSLFCKLDNYTFTTILVYIDDIIITENNLEEMRNVKEKLKERLDIKDLGILKYFLGIEITYSPKNIFISQRKYILDLLKETDKLDCKLALTQ